jgi:glycerophosphoryl diester phosphodiesterase
MRILKQSLIVAFIAFQSNLSWAQEPFPEIIPHRGGRAEWPENTLQSFKHCVDLGAMTLELDVQLTKDQKVVVYHPSDLAINTNGFGKIAEHTLEELKRLDAGFQFQKENRFPFRNKGYTIPSLEEVITTFPQNPLIIDLKSLPAKNLIEAIAIVVERYDAWGRLIFYSTSDTHLDYLKKTYPKALVFESRGDTLAELLTVHGSPNIQPTDNTCFLGFELIRDVILEENLALGTVRYPLQLPCWSPEKVQKLRKKLPNGAFVIFGVNSLQAYQEAIKLKVDAVYTDSPTLLFEYVKSQRQGRANPQKISAIITGDF